MDVFVRTMHHVPARVTGVTMPYPDLRELPRWSGKREQSMPAEPAIPVHQFLVASGINNPPFVRNMTTIIRKTVDTRCAMTIYLILVHPYIPCITQLPVCR